MPRTCLSYLPQGAIDRLARLKRETDEERSKEEKKEGEVKYES